MTFCSKSTLGTWGWFRRRATADGSAYALVRLFETLEGEKPGSLDNGKEGCSISRNSVMSSFLISGTRTSIALAASMPFSET